MAIAVACSRGWKERGVPVGAAVRRAGIACCSVIFLQLGVAAVMRHSFAGLAIPTFPWSTPEGSLLPADWDFRVAIAFAHRVMAVFVSLAVLVLVLSIWRDRGAPIGMRTGASLLLSLVSVQVLLGATIIWTRRDPGVMTLHVLVGALTLVTAFWLTWTAHRDRVEGASS
jgi:cytochrome c oxidase assembly protein subunit 15